jgi:hypothetical protein
VQLCKSVFPVVGCDAAGQHLLIGQEMVGVFRGSEPSLILKVHQLTLEHGLSGKESLGCEGLAPL